MGIAQLLRVLKADVGNDRSLRHGDDVGGVQPTAEAYLQHCNVTALLLKIAQSNGGHQLEFRGLLGHTLRRGKHALRQRDELPIGDKRVVHLHALVEAVQVRRGEQPRAIACSAQHGRHDRRCGALAVRAGDVDEFQFVLRIPKTGKQFPRAVQTGLAPDPGALMDQRNSLFSSHTAPSLPVWRISASMQTLSPATPRVSIAAPRISTDSPAVSRAERAPQRTVHAPSAQ